MKGKLVYIGNVLEGKSNPTTIDTMGNFLQTEFEVVTYSANKNPVIRLLHMMWGIFKNRDAKFVLIDTYRESAFYFAVCSAWVARGIGVPYIPILHGAKLKERVKESPQLIKRYFTHAHKVITPSTYLKQQFKDFKGVDFEVIPNNIQIGNYPFATKNIKDIRLLWVRAYQRTYAPIQAIKILSTLHQVGFTHASLCMVGPDKDGSLKESIQLADQLGLTKFIDFKGLKSKKEIVEIAKGYNFFLNTRIIDNTPVSVIEAMALGLPVIASKEGGMPYMLEDGKEGVLVSMQTPEPAAKAIVDLVKDPVKYQTLAANARKKAEAWDWDTKVKYNMIELLK